MLRLPGHHGRDRDEPAPGRGDEQPLDATAFVEAELAALVATGTGTTGRVRATRSNGSWAATGSTARSTTSQREAAATAWAKPTSTRTRAPNPRWPSIAPSCCSMPPRSRRPTDASPGQSGVTSNHEVFRRHAGNPILTAADWSQPVNAVFNPAAAVVDGETVVLARVEDRRGISHLAVARSADGLSGWSIAPEPLLAPVDGVESEQWGFEDPRAVWVAELERWLITCTAYGPSGPAVYLASTTDFRTVERIGIICQPEDKNAAVLSERVDGQWVLFHRPMTSYAARVARSFSLGRTTWTNWGTPEQVLEPRDGAWWDSLRIGIGPPPLRTDDGWLVIYHGVKETVAGTIYRVGLALTALDDPARVLHRASTGCWGLPPRMNARATYPIRCSRAGSCTTRSRARSGCTTGRRHHDLCRDRTAR